jgi:hypothetical protein
MRKRSAQQQPGRHPRVTVRCSEEFRLAVLIDPRKQHELAAIVSRDRSYLSAQLNGIVPVRPDDPVLRHLARLVHVPVRRAFVRCAAGTPPGGQTPRATRQLAQRLARRQAQQTDVDSASAQRRPAAAIESPPDCAALIE